LTKEDLKRAAVRFMGGECSLCHYNKCLGALHFHHIDPSQKDFNISAENSMWCKIETELKKCILLCANCHAEVHAGIHNVNILIALANARRRK
jgi:hypothetical protein